jgi:uncharacterized membrane protein
MADLVVIGYPDEATAKSVYAKVEQLRKDGIVDGTAAIVMPRTDDGILAALMDQLAASGIDDEFRSRVRQVLKPSGSAVVLTFAELMPDKALAALAPYGGNVLETSLSAEAEHEIRNALGGSPSAPTSIGVGPS